MALRRILIVQGDGAARDQIASWVQSMGFEVITVASGAEAVSRLNAAKVAAILYRMEPDRLADLGAFARVRELPNGKELPIVALAASAHYDRARSLGAALGIREYMTIPVEGARLAETLKRLIPEAEESPDASGPLPSYTGEVSIQELRHVHAKIVKLDFFERLRVPQETTGADVRRAYRRAVGRYAPDVVVGSEARRLLRDIYDAFGEAYRVLRDDDKREEYTYALRRKAATDEAPPEPAQTFEPTPEPWTEPAVVPPTEAPPPSAARPQMTPPPAPTPPPSLFAPSPPPTPPIPQTEQVSFAAVEAPEPEGAVPTYGEAASLFDSEPTGLFDPTPAPESYVGSEPEFTPPRFDATDSSPPSLTPAPEKSDSTTTAPDTATDIWDRRYGAQRETHEELAAAAHLQAVMGDYDGAVQLLQQCLVLKRDDPEYQYLLDLNQGRRLRKLGNKARARQHFEQAVKNARPGSSAAQEELDELLGGGDKARGGRLGRLFGRKKK